jgi:hypothetical protein
MKSISKWLIATLVGGFIAIALDLCETYVPYVPPDPPPEPPTNTPIAAVVSTLPVEVLGPPDSTGSWALLVTNATTATELYQKIHSPGEGKISLRINGGSWVTYTSNNIVQSTVQKAFYGLDGIQHTVEFTSSLTNWTLVDPPATNTFEWRFNDIDGLTIGYRVLDFNVRHAGTNLIASVQLPEENPATWVASTNLVNISAGQQAWYTSNIFEASLPINARCTSCHFEDGSDLKLLNYSQKSIILRSQFHSVPLAVATNIAEYISSLNYPYQTNGRPWNPPYQPWTNADSVLPVYWFAGGGLGAVLSTDTNTLSYIFPSAITTNSIDFDNTLNARQTPLAVQFPDWNHWLPRKHPLDMVPPLAATNGYLTIYSTMRTNIYGKTAIETATIVNAQKSNWDRAGSAAGITKPIPFTDANHWRSVKEAELGNMHLGQVQNQGTALFGALSDNLRWFHGTVFRLGPHVLGTSPKPPWFYVESMQWYQLQLVLNSGNRLNGGIVPIDWGYQIGLNRSAWNNPENYAQYASQLVNQIKAGEVVSNGLAPDDPNGWDIFKVNLGYMTGNATLYGQVPLATRQQITGALLTAWLEQSERWTTNQYYASQTLSSVSKINSASNTLAYITTQYTTLGVDPNVMSRFLNFRNFLFP